MSLVHFLRSDNYYACIQAVGNEVKGVATKNWRLVTCMNCRKVMWRYRRERRAAP
jgi:hypothetical protein